MEHIIKNKYKRAVLFCLLVLSIMAFFAQTAFAAPAMNPLTLTVEQDFTFDGTPATDTFTYKMTAKTAGAPMPSGASGDSYTFTISGTDNISLGGLSYTEVGTYIYEFAQQVGTPLTGYTYDREVYTVSVYVDYGLNVDVVVAKSNNDKTGKIRFQNDFAPLPTALEAMENVPVKKTVIDNPRIDGKFTFKLEAQNKTYPMPAGSEDGVKLITMIGPGQMKFGVWSYTKTGTYYYTVSEVNNRSTRYVYDEQTYTITDRVWEDNGQLILDRIVTNDSNNRVENFTFINIHKYKDIDDVGSNKGPGVGVDSPNTGDDTNRSALVLTMTVASLVAMCCVAYLLILRRRRTGHCAAQD